MRGMGIARLAVLAAVLTGLAGAAFAADGPKWIRFPAISPDGGKIAFTYRGQIYVVDPDGDGLAEPVTSQGYYAYGPVWKPDSLELAFASDINGDDDVYVTDFASGVLRRLTWSSSGEVPTSFTPDGSAVLFTHVGLGDPVASLQTALNGRPHLYRVDLATDRKTLVLPNEAGQAVWNRDGTELLYTYNPSLDPEARQLRVASNARQVWLYDAAERTHRRLFVTRFDALNPVWGPGDRSIYYLGEASGTLNVWRHDRESGEDRQVTFFTDHPVRFLSASDAGDLVFAHNGRVHRIRAGAAAPEEVAITIPEQRMDQPERRRATAVSEFVSSPDGAYFAVIVDAEVFLADRSGNYRRITDTPDPERNVAFSPDGALLVYAAQRDHVWGIYGVDLRRGEVGEALALTYEEVPLVVGDENAFQPEFSPDGSKLAYISGRREVKVLDLATGETVSLFGEDDHNTSYSDGDLWFSWSPDARHLLVRWKHVPFSVVEKAGVVPADGSGPIRPLTLGVTEIKRGVWSADGTQIVASTPMYGLRTLDQGGAFADLYRVFMSDEARGDFLDRIDGTFSQGPLDDEQGPVLAEYDFQEERNSYLEGRLTGDGAIHLLYVPLEDGPYVLSVVVDMGMNLSAVAVDLRDGSMNEIVSLEGLDVENVAYVPATRALDVKTGEGVVTIPIHQPDQRGFTPLTIDYTVDPREKREAAFEQVWADIRFKYYRSDVEGRDWERIGDYYRGFLGSIASERELAKLVDEMFGEISASHLFVGYRADRPRATLRTDTASLGVFADYSHEGQGVRIAAILPGGPLDRSSLGVAPGDVIVSVNGRPVPDRGGLHRALDGMAGRQVAVGLLSGGDERQVIARAIDLDQEQALNHQRWIDTRRALTAELSNGCVVYQYVPEMDNDSYVDAYGRLLAARDTARAALIDVRSNRGGNLHRQLLNFLTGEAFAYVGREDRGWEAEPLDRWIGSSAVLIDSFSYSDGSVFPQAYQDLGIGPLVGDRLLNTGTGVNYVRSLLVPGLTYGIPVQPFRKLDGTYYENLEIEPDIAVPYDPGMAGQGRDPQLEAAVAALMEEIGEPDGCRP